MGRDKGGKEGAKRDRRDAKRDKGGVKGDKGGKRGVKRDAERASRYMSRKHVRSHDFSTYADICRLPQTRAFGAQTVLRRQS